MVFKAGKPPIRLSRATEKVKVVVVEEEMVEEVVFTRENRGGSALEVVVEEGVVFTRENRGVSARRQMCAYVLARGSGCEARRCKTQGLRQQSTGECESGSKSTSRTVIDKSGLSRCCCCCSNFD